MCSCSLPLPLLLPHQHSLSICSGLAFYLRVHFEFYIFPQPESSYPSVSNSDYAIMHKFWNIKSKVNDLTVSVASTKPSSTAFIHTQSSPPTLCTPMILPLAHIKHCKWHNSSRPVGTGLTKLHQLQLVEHFKQMILGE